MVKSKVVTELGQLIDSSEEDFRKYCSDKSVGYLSSFHNLMVQTYNQVLSLKRDLVQQMIDKDEENDPKKKEILEGLYSKLLRVEQRVFIIREYIKSKSLKKPGSDDQTTFEELDT